MSKRLMVRYFSLMLFIRKSTLIYNSLLVTRLTQHFFFAKRNAGCQCCFLLKVSVNLAYFYVLISPPSLPPTPPPPPTPLPKTSTTPDSSVAG